MYHLDPSNLVSSIKEGHYAHWKYGLDIGLEGYGIDEHAISNVLM